MLHIPVYFSHSYRREDREVNAHFWSIFYNAGFSFTVDPGSTSLYTTALELMMARSVGFAAVVTYRREEERYLCSPFVMYEYGLAVQAHKPRLVLRDKRVPPRNFRAQGTLEVEFDVAALDRSTYELTAKLKQFHTQASGRLDGYRYRLDRAGLAIGTEVDEGEVSALDRREAVERNLDEGGYEPMDLAAVADDPSQLAQAADACDFVIIDIDDAQTSRIADFLLGRGTPLLKMARRRAGLNLPERLLGSAPLRRAAAGDELVMYWGGAEDFEGRVRQQLALATTDRTELTDLDIGNRYFRNLGRDVQPVFLSNARAVNDLAKELADALVLENISFFHYRYQNQIGVGERWNDQLERMVAASKVFAPLIDDSYWQSEFCRREYEAAAHLAEEGRITMVPGLLDGYDNGPSVPYQGVPLQDMPRQAQVDLVIARLNELFDAPAGTALAGSGPLEAGRASVDVAILTILPEEYEAVLCLLKNVRQVAGSATLPNQHSWVVGEVGMETSPVPYTVALAMSPRPGTDTAVIVTKNTLQAFRPQCVLVVGIAGGLEGLSLGDVIVADRICAYEYGKLDHGFHPRQDMDSRTDAVIASMARTLAMRHPDWYSRLEQPEEFRHLAPRILVGAVASGDKVVDDPTDEFFASVMKSRPKLQAVEMEGAGTAAAIQDAREMLQAVSFGMIRGISDIPRAGGSEPGTKSGTSGQTQMRDTWKPAAAAAAAATAIQLIRLSWPRPPRAGSSP